MDGRSHLVSHFHTHTERGRGKEVGTERGRERARERDCESEIERIRTYVSFIPVIRLRAAFKKWYSISGIQ